MISKNITFIGVGHISHAIIDGLFKGKIIKSNQIILSGPRFMHFDDLKNKYAVKTTTSNVEAVKNADIIFIGVRPKIVREVINEIKSYIKKDSLIISIAAGVTFDLLEKYFQRQEINLIRIMPNIPVAYGIGVVGWIGNKNITNENRKLVKQLLKPLGLSIECNNEEKMDKLSMISGCGIGYVVYFMKNLENIAKTYGIRSEEAVKIVRNVFSGTLRHLEFTNQTAGELMQAVATPGGITEEVINNFEANNLNKIFSESVEKGYDKMNRMTSAFRKESKNGNN